MSRLPLLSSLKTRIALFATALFMAAIWGMAYRSAEKLRHDEQQLLSTQQFAYASFIADSIDAAIRLRIETLGLVAAAIQPEWLSNPAKLDRYLEARLSIYTLFGKGLCILDAGGRCLASRPALPGRTGTSYGRQDFFRQVMATGKPAIGRPVVDALWSHQPVLVIAVPIRDRGGATVGVLAGTLPLASNDIFEAVAHPRATIPGSVLVISPQDGIFVAATDPARVMQPLPPPGANELHDRSMAGFEGSGITISSRGVEELCSIKRVPSTGWLVAARLPTAEAFAPLRAMQRGIYLDAALSSLAVALLIWLFVYRELRSLGRSAAALDAMTHGTAPFHPLPVDGSHEIACLQENFNDLQARIVRQQEALTASEARFRQMFEGSSWIAYLIDPASGRIVDANQAAADFWGYPVEELRGMDMRRINIASAEELQAHHEKATASERIHREWRHRLRNGEIRDVETFVCALADGDGATLYTIAHDITDRKLRETQEGLRNRIFELLARDGDLGEILGLVVAYVETAHGDILCSILLADEGGTQLHNGAPNRLPEEFNRAADGLPIADGAGSCGTAAFRGERVIVENIAEHPLWREGRELAARAGLAASWSEPIKDSAGRVLGTFALYRREPGVPPQAEIDLVLQATNLASVAIEKKRNDAELQLASSVYQHSDEAIVVTDAANRIVAVNPAFTRLTGYGADEVRGRDPKFLSAGRTPRAEYDAMWEALRATGQWQGEIWNRRKNGEDYAEWLTINTLRNAAGEVHRYIAMFSDITEKKRTEELVWRQANYDSLTGLPNRNLFYDRLHQEVRKIQRTKLLLALLFIDLDRFKEVNDALGHDAGDALLKEAAARIAACVRDSDTVARLGGDEFTVVLPGLADIGRVEQVARDIVDRLAQPFQLAQPAYVSASIGIALYPTDAEDAESLLKSADQAMYAAKEAGRNGFSYFTDSMQSAAQVRMQLGSALREALGAGQFELYFQPIVDMRSGRIVKAEALLRWRHPEHGLIMPAAFIPLAEEIGLIGEIGDWVFRESAHIAKRWYNEDRTEVAVYCPIQVSVNKSPRQFVGAKTRESWLGYLHKIGLPASFIAIEITEGLLLDDSPEVTAELEEFRASGVQVALDDFGTGYSAMSYLNKFHVDYVKIDQSFVQGISPEGNDRAIVEAIVAMAHKLGLKVIAEGVETEAQRAFLAAIECDYAQGYLFAKPLPQKDFEALLATGTLIPAPGGGE